MGKDEKWFDKAFSGGYNFTIRELSDICYILNVELKIQLLCS
jgi:hypothetical protein